MGKKKDDSKVLGTEQLVGRLEFYLLRELQVEVGRKSVPFPTLKQPKTFCHSAAQRFVSSLDGRSL